MGQREQRALHRAAALGELAKVRRVLEREPSLAATVDAQLRTPLHNVARGTSMPTSRQAIAAMLLAAAPEMAGAVDHEGCTALHYAAAKGPQGLARQLMTAAPAAVALPNMFGRLPIHVAAACPGASALVAALLAVAPWTATATTNGNRTPLFEAARTDEESALILLAEAPAAAAVRTMQFLRFGWTALHAAAYAGHPRVVAAILEAAPELALVGDSNADLPLHWVSQFGLALAHTEARRLLIAAAPQACLMKDGDGDTPLMCATIQGNKGAVVQLLEAAPAAACIANKKGLLPIQVALQRCYRAANDQPLQLVRHLLGAGNTADVAAALGKAAGDACEALAAAAQQMCAEFVARRALTAEQWALLPGELPGLEAALPAVLARSEAEAACLVARLPAAERMWVQAAMLSLARVQRRTQLPVPAPALQLIVSLAVEPVLPP